VVIDSSSSSNQSSEGRTAPSSPAAPSTSTDWVSYDLSSLAMSDSSGDVGAGGIEKVWTEPSASEALTCGTL
jgi:hypothetical protein